MYFLLENFIPNPGNENMQNPCKIHKNLKPYLELGLILKTFLEQWNSSK